MALFKWIHVLESYNNPEHRGNVKKIRWDYNLSVNIDGFLPSWEIAEYR